MVEFSLCQFIVEIRGTFHIISREELMRLSFKILIWFTCIILLFTVTGFFLVPPVMKSVLIKKLSSNLQREVSISQIKLNPYSLSVLIKGFTIKDRSKKYNAVSMDEIFINASISSVFKKAIIFKELKINGPYFRVTRNNDETYNFSDLFPTKKEIKDKPQGTLKKTKKSKPLLFSINNISISGGRIDFFDLKRNIEHNVKEIKIAIPFISNTEYHLNTYVEPLFSAKIDGTPYVLNGKTKPFAEPREAYLDINIKGFNFARYIPYFPKKPDFILYSGTMDLSARISFLQPEKREPSLMIKGDVAIKNFFVDDMKKQPLVRLPSVDIAILSCEPLIKSIHLSKVAIIEPALTLKRDEEGSFKLPLFVEEKKEVIRKGISDKKLLKNNKKLSVKADEDDRFNVLIDGLIVEKGRVSFSDNSLSQPVALLITSLNLKGENFSTAKQNTGNLSLSFLLNKEGNISLRGPVSINPIAAKLLMDMKKVNIGAFQPYFTDKVKINTTSGHVNTSGTIAINHKEKSGWNATFNGNAFIADFASVDKYNGDDFLKWKNFSFRNIDAGYNPMYFHVKSVSLTDFYTRVTLNQDGTLSLRKVIEEEDSNTGSGETPGEDKVNKEKEKENVAQKIDNNSGKDISKDISVGSITLQGGTIDFMDKAIKPAYSVNLTEMTGRVSGFSLKLDQRADVELRGKIDHHIPLEIKGKINPSRNNLFTDVSVGFENFDLSAMTPYSGKYLGYKIEKGNLSIDLKYLIDKRKLDSENRIFIDQLILGEKVQSPDAVNLPIKLAIALLKDRKGRIELDVPVSGSLDDPEFSVFRIVVKVLVNLITKAATAPFALLGALFGGGEELSYIEFDYGKAQLSQANMKKIDALANALYQRPSLKLDIEGHVDVEKDRGALKIYLFNKKIKAQKLNTMIKKGIKALPVDDISIEQDEYEKYLTMAYKAEKFEKPRNVMGFAKKLPLSEMEKLMLANTLVDDGELRILAKKRAAKTRDALIATDKVTVDRIFVVEPKLLSPEKKGKKSLSRVDFILK